VSSVLHPSASVVPACLAAGELAGSTGRQLVAAIAGGLEACVRLGMAGYDAGARNSVYLDRGQHATSICGTIAGAGAAAALLGLDVDGVANAMSVAASMAGGVIEANRTGGTVKRIHCGWAAHAATSAASLVACGITGPPTVLEGRLGFFRAFLDDHYDASALTDGLGTTWTVPGINFKPYPANHFTHAGIDAAIALRERGLRPEDVSSLVLGVSAPVVRTIGEPIEVKRRPETGYQAQFSGPYTVAAALVGGHGLGLGLQDFTDELAQEPTRRALAAKVEVVEDPECSEIFPRQFAAVLTATTTSGDTITERVMVNRGGSQRPLTDAELSVKFADNVKGIIDASAARELEQAVARLETTAAGACLEPLARALQLA
jgi:2-methylcitrate dehydratase PrpD